MLAVLAIGCLLVLRRFFTAVCFALILVVATWPAFERLQHMFGGRKTLAALPMATLARLVFVAPPALDGLQRRRHDPSHPHLTPTVVSAWSQAGLRSLA